MIDFFLTRILHFILNEITGRVFHIPPILLRF